MQDLLLGEVAEGKLADEIIGARLLRHPSDLLADRAWRPRNGPAILHHRIKIFRQTRKARLGAVLLPELHEAGVEIRPGPATELHRVAVAIGRDHEAVDPKQGQI